MCIRDRELVAEDIVIEIPRDLSHGDYSTNMAMQLTRILTVSYTHLTSQMNMQLAESIGIDTG